MNLSEFCQLFYGQSRKKAKIKGKISQPSIVEFFMSTALGEMAKTELVYSEDLFRKWYRGEREPQSSLWVSVQKSFDHTVFSRVLSSSLNEKVLPELLEAFGIIIQAGEVADKYAFASALATQFKAIADGCGEAADVVRAIYQDCLNVSEFPDYLCNAQKKYAKMKTLLYTSEERPFDEFFVCNTISTTPGRYKRSNSGNNIENVTLSKLAEKSQCVLLVGMGGIGKSMMMRHLFLSSIKRFSETGILPILVTLREYSTTNNDVFNLIVDSVHRFDITFSAAHVHKLLREGKCQVLLDGLDEIKAGDMDYFLRKLDALIDRYPHSQYVMSSRRISAFVELPRFTVLWMMPFDHAQALELIDKLEYCPEEPKLKQQFRERLEKEYFKTHAEFVTNPLLLTLMLMNFRRFSDVPEKKYLFYEQAYQTLLQRHDSDKLAYKRVFRSVTDPADFTWVFRELCAKSYRKGDYEFDRKKFEEYFVKLNALSRMDSEIMKPDNFLYDVCHSACLMYEEGQSYHFLHRSFQEYFFAEYYSRVDDTTMRRLGEYIEKSDQMLFDEGNAFDMLYDLAPEKVERFIIIPFLEQIFEAWSGKDKYWAFLRATFVSWSYIVLEDDVMEEYREKYSVRERYPKIRNEIEPASVIMSLIFRLNKISAHFFIGGFEEKYEDLVYGTLYGEGMRMRDETIAAIGLMSFPDRYTTHLNDRDKAEYLRHVLRDEDGHPVEFGHMYEFDFARATTEPEKYPAIIALWEKETCQARKMYSEVEKYYEQLKLKYAHADEFDDDNF